MKKILEQRLRTVNGCRPQELKILEKDSFRFHKGKDGRPDYFPASIVQSFNDQDRIVNEMRVFDMKYEAEGEAIPDEGLLRKMKRTETSRSKCMYCITMYNENFNQFLQSLAGCIRSIGELNKKDSEAYAPNKFGIVLVGDGIDKINQKFIDYLEEFNMFDSKAGGNTVLNTDMNKDEVKRSFEDPNYAFNNNEGYKGSYASKNIAHIFSNVLKDEDLKQILDL